MSVLTVDLGNSRLKACLWTRSEAGLTCAQRWTGDLADLRGLEAWLARQPPGTTALSSVAEREQTERVRTLLQRPGVLLFDAPASDLDNRCLEPERVGLDRLYAAAGAAILLRRSCIVVDAGTAITVDAVRVGRGAPVFLGGAIAPGPVLSARALAVGTARLPRIVPRPGPSALGRTTEEAIQAGVVLGFRGAAAGLVETVAVESSLGDAPVVLTGGASEFLLVPRPFTTRVLEVVPELVHRGLLAALERVVGAARLQ